MNFLKRLAGRVSAGGSSEEAARPRIKRLLIDYDSTLNPGQGNQPLTGERAKLLQRFLADWRALGLELYVLTSSNPAVKEDALRAAGLLDLFAAVLSSSFPKKFGTKGEYLSKRIKEDGWKASEQILIDDSLEAIQSIWQSSDGEVLSSPLAHSLRLPQHSKDGLVEADLQQLDSMIKDSATTTEPDLFLHVYSFLFNGDRSVDLNDSLQKSTLDTLPEEQKACVLNANTPEMRKAWMSGRPDFAAMIDESKPVVKESPAAAKVPAPKAKPWQPPASKVKGKGAGKPATLGAEILSPAAQFCRVRSISPAPDMTKSKERAPLLRASHRALSREKDNGASKEASASSVDAKGKGKTKGEALAKGKEAAGKAKGKGKPDPAAGKGKTEGDVQQPSADASAGTAKSKGKDKMDPTSGKGNANGIAQEPPLASPDAAPVAVKSKGKGKAGPPAGKGQAEGDVQETSVGASATAEEGEGKGKADLPVGKGKAQGDAQVSSMGTPAAATESQGKSKGKTSPPASKGKAKEGAQEPSTDFSAAASECRREGEAELPSEKGSVSAAAIEGKGPGKTGLPAAKGKTKGDAQEPSTNTTAGTVEGNGIADLPGEKEQAKGDANECSADTSGAAAQGKGKGKIGPPVVKGKGKGDTQEHSASTPAAAAEGKGKGQSNRPAMEVSVEGGAQEPSVDPPAEGVDGKAKGKGKGKTNSIPVKGKAKGDAQEPSVDPSTAAAKEIGVDGQTASAELSSRLENDQAQRSVRFDAESLDSSPEQRGLDRSRMTTMSMTSACSIQTQSSEIWDNGGMAGRNTFFRDNGLMLPPGGFPDPKPDNKPGTMNCGTVNAPYGVPSASSNAVVESVCVSVGPFSQSKQSAIRFEPPEGEGKFGEAAKFIRASIAVASPPAGGDNAATSRQEELHEELASVEEKARKAEREQVHQAELERAREALDAEEEGEMTSLKSRRTERRTAVQPRRASSSTIDITEMAVPGESIAPDAARAAAATPSSSSSSPTAKTRTVTFSGGPEIENVEAMDGKDAEEELMQISNQIEQLAHRKTARKTQLLQSLHPGIDDLATETRARTGTVSGFTELQSDSGQAVSQPTRQSVFSAAPATAASVDMFDLNRALDRMEVATDLVSNSLSKQHDATMPDHHISNSDLWEVGAAVDRIERAAVLMEHG